MRPAGEIELALARGVVQRHAVEVRDAGDDAQRVARGTVPRRGERVGEAEGPPDELGVHVCQLGVVEAAIRDGKEERRKERGRGRREEGGGGREITHYRYALHAQHEEVRGEVARVGERIFLP